MSDLRTSSLSEISVPSVTSNRSVVPVPEGCVIRQAFQFIPWDNEDNLVTKEAEIIFRFVLSGIFLPVLFIVGSSTNIISMVVFYKHGLQERINACLFTLSLVDLLGISAAFCFDGDVLYMFIKGKQTELGPFTQFFFGNHLTGLYGLVTASQIVYSVIAVERCLCITRPLLVKSFMSTKTTVLVLWVMIFIVSGGLIFIAGVRYSLVCMFEPADNSLSYVPYPTEFYFRHRFILDTVYSVFYGMLFPCLSLVCVTVCTIITTVKLKKLSKWRETVSSASDSVTSRDIAITRVLLCTSILFIICVVPAVVLRLSSFVVSELRVGGRYDNLARIFIKCYQTASAINNTFNFFIYYIFGSKFRETTHRLFSFCHRDKHEEQSGDI